MDEADGTKCYCVFPEFVRSRVGKHEDGLPQTLRQKNVFFKTNFTKSPPWNDRKKRTCFFAGRIEDGPLQKFAKKRGVVSDRVVNVFIFWVFKLRSFFLELLQFVSVLFRFTQLMSKIISILRVWSDAKRILCWVWLLTRCQCVGVRFCHKLVRRSSMYFCVTWFSFDTFSLMGFVTITCQRDQENDRLFTHF